MRELRLEVAGQPIRCLTSGQGKPLILCHGFLSSAEEFGGRFSALSAQRRLIIPDLPGNGGSAPLAVRHTVDSLAATVEELLNGLKIAEFDLAGVCLGAAVACGLAARCGDRIDRMVVHTPLVAPALLRPLYRAQVRVLTLPPLWRGVVALSRNRRVSDLYKKYVIAEGNVDARTSQANFVNQVQADPWAAREWLQDGVRHRGLTALLDRKRPTLVIVAEHDNVVDSVRLRRILGGRANIRLFVDREQGHGWNREAVRRQLGVMQEFFAEASDPARHRAA